MKNKLKNKYRILFLILGSLIFIYLVAGYGINNIVHNIEKTGLWFIPVILVWLVIYLLNTLTWSVVIKSVNSEISYTELLSIHISSSAINYLTPVVNLGGEPYRILASSEYIGNEKAISTSLLYNIFHIFSHIIFWTLCCFISILMFKDSSILLISLLVLLVLSSVVFLFVLGFKRGFLAILINVFKGRLLFKRLNRFLEEKVTKILKVDELIRNIYSHNRKYFFTALSSEFFSRIAASIEFFIILYSLNIHITLFDALYIYGAMSLFLNILFFVPMEAGTREASLYYLVGSLNISSQTGIYLSIVSRIREFIWIFLGLLLIKLKKSESQLQTR